MNIPKNIFTKIIKSKEVTIAIIQYKGIVFFAKDLKCSFVNVDVIALLVLFFIVSQILS